MEDGNRQRAELPVISCLRLEIEHLPSVLFQITLRFSRLAATPRRSAFAAKVRRYPPPHFFSTLPLSCPPALCLAASSVFYYASSTSICTSLCGPAVCQPLLLSLWSLSSPCRRSYPSYRLFLPRLLWRHFCSPRSQSVEPLSSSSFMLQVFGGKRAAGISLQC